MPCGERSGLEENGIFKEHFRIQLHFYNYFFFIKIGHVLSSFAIPFISSQYKNKIYMML